MSSSSLPKALGFALLASLATSGVATARTVTLAEALATAHKSNPAIRAGTAGIEAAKHDREANRANYYPIIKVDGNLMVWDSALELSLGGDMSSADLSLLPPPATPYEMAFAAMLQGLAGMTGTTVREQVTGEVGLSLIQPITPLFTIGPAYELFDLGVSSRKLRQDQLVHDTALQTATAYFRALQVEVMLDNARQSVAQIAAQLERIEALVTSGIVGQDDRLKLLVALAAMKQDVLRAQTNVSITRTLLATSMGARESEVAPAPLGSEWVPQITDTLEESYAKALKARLEVRQLTTGIRQAELAADLEQSKLYPMLTFIAKYTHSEGSSFAQKDSFFAGLTLDFSAMRWHATTSALNAAKARVREARGQHAVLEAGIKLQVKQAYLRYTTSIKALAVAQQAITQAEESARLASRRFEAGDRTATDVVVAEAALAQARNNRVAAYFEMLVAHAEYRAALGEPLTADALLPGGTK